MKYHVRLFRFLEEQDTTRTIGKEKQVPGHSAMYLNTVPYSLPYNRYGRSSFRGNLARIVQVTVNVFAVGIEGRRTVVSGKMCVGLEFLKVLSNVLLDSKNHDHILVQNTAQGSYH